MKELPIMSWADFEKLPTLERTVRIVEVDNKMWVELTMDDTTRFWESNIYDIDLSRSKDAHDLLKWVFHLSEKNWVTSDKIHDFIELVGRERGIHLRNLP